MNELELTRKLDEVTQLTLLAKKHIERMDELSEILESLLNVGIQLGNARDKNSPIIKELSERLKTLRTQNIQSSNSERDEWVQNVIKELTESTGFDFTYEGDIQVVKAMYDLNYRKREE